MNAEQLLKSVARAEELGKRFYPHLIETHSPQAASVPNTPSPNGMTEDSARKDNGGLTCEDESPVDNSSYRTPNNEGGSEIQPSSAIQVEPNEQNSDILTQYIQTKINKSMKEFDGQTLVDEAETRIIVK